MKQIKILHFFTGEDIIGQIISKNEDSYTIEMPVRMIFVPEKKTMALLPMFLFTEQTEFVFNKSVVLTEYLPTTEIINQYNIQFGSGLVVPEKSGLILPN